MNSVSCNILQTRSQTVCRYQLFQQPTHLGSRCTRAPKRHVNIRRHAGENNLLITWEATGVPVLEKLHQFSGFEAAVHSVQIISTSLVCIYLMKFISDWLNKGSTAVEEEGIRPLNPIKSLLYSFTGPLSRILPFLGYTYTCTVVLSLITVYDVYLEQALEKTMFDEALMVRGVRLLAQLCQDLVDLCYILVTTWTVKNIKDRVTNYVLNKYLNGVTSNSGLNRMLLTFSYLLDYVLYIGAGLAGLNAFGFDISPLLASLGASSVVIGIAARNVLENFAAAITLYTAPPFAIGDEVRLLNYQNVVAEGKIVAIEPLRTIIETPEQSTLYISNSLVIKWMVDNLSQNPEKIDAHSIVKSGTESVEEQ